MCGSNPGHKGSFYRSATTAYFEPFRRPSTKFSFVPGGRTVHEVIADYLDPTKCDHDVAKDYGQQLTQEPSNLLSQSQNDRCANYAYSPQDAPSSPKRRKRFGLSQNHANSTFQDEPRELRAALVDLERALNLTVACTETEKALSSSTINTTNSSAPSHPIDREPNVLLKAAVCQPPLVVSTEPCTSSPIETALESSGKRMRTLSPTCITAAGNIAEDLPSSTAPHSPGLSSGPDILSSDSDQDEPGRHLLPGGLSIDFDPHLSKKVTDPTHPQPADDRPLGPVSDLMSSAVTNPAFPASMPLEPVRKSWLTGR